MSRLLPELINLIVPAGCAGCSAPDESPLCSRCRAELTTFRPGRVCPEPAPAGLPACYAAGQYAGRLRSVVLAYKDRGRYDLTGPLAALLAGVVVRAVPARRPVVLVPVPTTARAIRQRRTDHMLRLARAAAVRLRSAGRPAVALPALRSLPRPDSVGLSREERATAARRSVVTRPTLPLRRMLVDRREFAENSAFPGPPAVLVVDDVMTTGSTLVATCEVLASEGLHAETAAVLAAAGRRHRPGAPLSPGREVQAWAGSPVPADRRRTQGDGNSSGG